MSFWNEEEEQQPEYSGIEDGELVTCILLDTRFPSGYLKEIEERQAGANEEAEAFGEPADAILPSHKEGGIEIGFAVLYRDRCTGGQLMENVIKIDGDDLIEPDYVCFGALRALPPLMVKNARYYGSLKGYGKSNQNGRPKIIDVYPPRFEKRDWKHGLDYSDYASDEELQKQYPADYKRLCALESERLQNWQRDIEAFAAMDEEKATAMLLDSISASYGLARLNEETNRWEYIKPEKGVMFQCRISKRKDSRFLNIEKFRYNSDTREHEFYGTMQVSPPQEEDRQFADRVIQMRETNKALRAERAAERNSVAVTADDDDLPF